MDDEAYKFTRFLLSRVAEGRIIKLTQGSSVPMTLPHDVILTVPAPSTTAD
jgi:hypothetical protein